MLLNSFSLGCLFRERKMKLMKRIQQHHVVKARRLSYRYTIPCRRRRDEFCAFFVYFLFVCYVYLTVFLISNNEIELKPNSNFTKQNRVSHAKDDTSVARREDAEQNSARSESTILAVPRRLKIWALGIWNKKSLQGSKWKRSWK